MNQNNNFEIDFANVNHADEIAVLEKEFFSSPWSKNQIIEEILNENSIFLVATNDNKVVGYISGKKVLDEFYISNIGVMLLYRKQNIATNLLEFLLEILRSELFSFVTLEVRKSNYSAIKLYEKFSFQKVGERKNFYSSPVEDAFIYTLFFNK